MENDGRVRAFSSPELLLPLPASSAEGPEDYSLEGVATNVRLLLKIIQDHNDASTKDNDDRKMRRFAGMVTILDDVKLRIQKFQSGKKKAPQLRRCSTDLRRSQAPADKKPQEPVSDEKERLRKQLNASMAARKSLEMMCSSLGKEKEIMAAEIARKVRELNEAEELVNDLKAQNETLMSKLQVRATQKKGSNSGGETQGNAALQERNRTLSEQLLKSLDSCRSLKRKYKVAKDENREICASMDVIKMEVGAGLEKIRSFRSRVAISKDIEEEISTLEKMFQGFDMKISKHRDNECAKPKAAINTSKPLCS
jgi:chromosome segregation ATPase